MAAAPQARQSTAGRFPPGATLLPDPGGIPLPLLRTKKREEELRQAALFAAGRNIWTGKPVGVPQAAIGPPPRPVAAPLPQRTWLDRSPTAKTVAGAAALGAGVVAGIPRGVVNNIKGAGEGLLFAGRLLNPLDPFLHPPGEAAWDDLVAAGGQALGYADRVRQRPDKLWDDLVQVGREQRLRLDPTATPQADTFAGELQRNFDVGQNDGEAAVDLAALAGGGAQLRGLRTLSAASRAARAARYVAELGLTPAQADRWAQRYQGWAHHVTPRSWTVPEEIGPIKVPEAFVGKPLPRSISESPFNKLNPPGLDFYQFNKLHYGVDEALKGGRLPGRGGWSGEKWGFKRYGMPARLWYGTPDATKWALIGPQVAGQAANAASMFGDDQ